MAIKVRIQFAVANSDREKSIERLVYEYMRYQPERYASRDSALTAALRREKRVFDSAYCEAEYFSGIEISIFKIEQRVI